MLLPDPENGRGNFTLNINKLKILEKQITKFISVKNWKQICSLSNHHS